MRAGGVVGDDSAKGGAIGGGRFSAEQEAMRFEGGIERVAHEARFDAGGMFLGVDVEDAPHVFGEIQDDGLADGLTGQAGAAAAREDGDIVTRRDFEGGLHVGGVARQYNADRFDLVVAGVGAVEGAGVGIEAHFAGDVLSKVVSEVRVHRYDVLRVAVV